MAGIAFQSVFIDMKKILLFGLLTFSMGISLLAQVELARESFEDSGGHGYNIYPDQECACCSGANVAWFRRQATGNTTCYPRTNLVDGSYFWATENTTRINQEIPGNPYGNSVVILELKKVEVTGYESLEVQFLAGHAILKEVENSDNVQIAYALDADIAADNYTTVAQFFGYGPDTTNLAYDANADGVLDGDTLSKDFKPFVADLGAITGDTLSVRFIFSSNQFGEDTSLDNIRVFGVLSSLPLELEHFFLSEKNESLDINWSTLNEINIASFQLQRSTDLSSWLTINQQSAKGAGDYTFQDTDLPSARTIYYRLQWQNFNGSTGYSPVRSFSPKSAFYVGTLYPNPLSGKSLQIDIQTQRSDLAKWQLFNTLGQLQQSGTFTLERGEERYLFEIKTLPAGMYYWQLEFDNRLVSRKLSIK